MNNYNEILNYKPYYNKYYHTIGANFDKSLDFVINNMNKEHNFLRYGGEDYFYHCINVANILQKHNLNDEDLLCTALLHDCIEDMENCSQIDIENLTNSNIAKSVLLVTKSQDVDYSIGKNLENYLNNILQDQNATLTKVADRMHNISSLTNVTEQKRQSKYKETKTYFLPFIKQAIKLYPKHSAFFNEAYTYFENLQ